MTPSTVALPDPLPLIGRASELATLEALLDGDGDGARTLFLRGEGGVGKSRLVTALAERARQRNWTVAHGRAYPVETGTPYAIFSDAWLPLLRELDASTVTVLSRGGDAELRMLFPALTPGPSDGAADASAEPDELRTRLMWNFTEFVKRFASRTPVLCVLEDIQWADGSSLELAHFLARQARDAPVALVLTYTEEERERSPRVVETERSLGSIGAAEVLRLQPLAREQVGELVARTFAVDADVVRDFSAVLYGWTRGNPFFVEEIVKSLVHRGTLRRESGTWVGWDAKEFDMPGTVRDAILSRLRHCSPEARLVADRAAVVGGRASHELLEAVSGLDTEPALRALEELRGLAVLDERMESGAVVYDFRHPLVRQTLYEEFGLQQARHLHGEVAEAMERLYGERAEDHADELAFHFARTDGGALREKATRYLIAAGRRALDRSADSEAIAYLEGALERSGRTADEASAELLATLARAHSHLGHFDQAARLLASALERLDEASPQYPAVCRTLGITQVWRGRHDEAERYFSLGLAAAESNRDDRSVVRLLVAQAHRLHELGRGEESLAVLERALPVADRLGDPALQARVHRSLALLRVWIGPPDEAFEHGQRAIELAQEAGDLGVEFWARWGLAVLTGMRGDTTGLGRALQEVDAIADRIRSPVLRLWTADLSVELAHATGDWDAGIAKGEKAIAVARALNQRTLLPRLLVWISQIHLGRNDLERAQELVDEAAAMAGIGTEDGEHDVHLVVPAYIGLAHLSLEIGDHDDAIAAAERGLEIAEGTGYVLWAMHLLLPVLAEACLWAGYIDRAEMVGRRMRAHATRIDHRLGLAWADACDALVRWKRGDVAGSVAPMRAAVEELERIPMLWTATRLRRQLAGRLLDLGEIEEGKRELDRVHKVCVDLRAGLELEKVRKMYHEVGLRPPAAPSSDGPMGLTATEFEVAKLVAEGMSNREIGGALGCSPRTVSTHLSNAYKKLEIGGPNARVRLGNLIRDAGLLE